MYGQDARLHASRKIWNSGGRRIWNSGTQERQGLKIAQPFIPVGENARNIEDTVVTKNLCVSGIFS
jgi:hypothetical protein